MLNLSRQRFNTELETENYKHNWKVIFNLLVLQKIELNSFIIQISSIL